MEEKKEIQAVVGQPVQITLQSMAGSTGYAWYLSHLEGGLVLSGTSVCPTEPGVSPLNHVFEFLAVKAGSFSVKFELLAPWRPADPGDSETYQVTISEPKRSAAEDIESAMQGKDFVPASAVNVGAQTGLKYGIPISTSSVVMYAAPIASAVVKYGVPMSCAAPVVEYAAPTAQSGAAMNVVPQTNILYAAPMVQSGAVTGVTPQSVVILYAAPMTQMQNAMMAYPQVVYAAPMSQSSSVAMGAQQPLVVYAAPTAMTQNAMAAYPQVVYAAPMSQSSPGSVAWTNSPVVLYAAPWMQNAMDVRQAATLSALYAVPMSQSGMCATPIMPYAAPWTSFGRCC